MGRRKTSPESIAELACEELIPYEVDRIANPNQQYNPQGGPPRTHDIVKLSHTIVSNKDTLLKQAYDLIIKNVANSIPMHCVSSCPHAETCMIDEDDRPYNLDVPHPECGFKCPVEYQLFYVMFYGYLAELDIDQASPIEVQTAANLAGIQVKKRRIDDLINQNGIMVEQVVGVDKASGTPITSWVAHPLLSTLDMLEKREDAIKKQFFVTRAQVESKKKELGKNELKTVAEFLSGFSAENRDDVIKTGE